MALSGGRLQDGHLVVDGVLPIGEGGQAGAELPLIQSGLCGQGWAEAVRPNRTCWRDAKAGERPSQTEKTNGCRQPLRAKMGLKVG